MSKSIYFIEKSYPFNTNDLSSSFIGGSEKTLINISSELAKKKNLKIKLGTNSPILQRDDTK